MRRLCLERGRSGLDLASGTIDGEGVFLVRDSSQPNCLEPMSKQCLKCVLRWANEGCVSPRERAESSHEGWSMT